MCLAPLLLAALVVADADKDAEKAFQEMNATLTGAKSFACRFEIKMASPQGKGSFKGRLVVIEGNKLRLEMKGEGGGKATDLLSVSDGTKMVTVDNQAAQPARETPKDLGKHVLTGTARGGIFVPMYLAVEAHVEGEKSRETDVAELLKVSGLKLGKNEKIDGKEAQVIDYVLTMTSADGLKLKATLWVDTKTHVPLKRLLTARVDGQDLSVTETYADVVVGGKVDAKTFELPK
jgi:outer membrane lipoprotein-sorting protein